LFICTCGCDSSGWVRWDSSSSETASLDADLPAGDGLPVVVVNSPASGSVISTAVYEGLSGITEPLPRGWRLFVIVHDGFRYYVQYPACDVSPRSGTFRQRNLRLQSDVPQQFELHVCVVEPFAVRQLEDLADQGEFSGLLSLPEGVHSTASVVVFREPSFAAAR
jgi:hypothetical protein